MKDLKVSRGKFCFEFKEIFHLEGKYFNELKRLHSKFPDNDSFAESLQESYVKAELTVAKMLSLQEFKVQTVVITWQYITSRALFYEEYYTIIRE